MIDFKCRPISSYFSCFGERRKWTRWWRDWWGQWPQNFGLEPPLRSITVQTGACISCLRCKQGINDFDLTAFAVGGVNITGLRLVDVLNKTVRDFMLERQSRARSATDISKARRISVSLSPCLRFSVCASVFYSLLFLSFCKRQCFYRAMHVEQSAVLLSKSSVCPSVCDLDIPRAYVFESN